MRQLLQLITSALLVLGLPACSRVGLASQKEEWHLLLLNGQPAGFTRQSEGETRAGNLTTSTLQHLVVRRAAETVEMEIEQALEETPQGGLARFRMVQRMARSDTVTEGVVRGAQLDLTSSGPGNSRRSTVTYDPRALGPRRLEQLLHEKLRRPGDSVSAVTFFPEKNGCGTLTATLREEESVEFPGGPRRLARRTTRTDVLPGIDVNEWIDSEGKVWKTSTSFLGMSIETLRSTAAEILKLKYAAPPEVFLSCSVRPDRPLKDAARASEVVYRFSLKSGDYRNRGIEKMFRGTGQTVLREESGSSRVVRIGKVLPGRAVRRPVAAPPGAEEALAPTAFIQSDDPLIQKLSAEAAAGETDAFETARRLSAWVRANVRFKDLKTAFASAKEVAEDREGDCTEHGVLLAAMARAAGIPARVVSGFVYYEGAFVGHLWTEVYVDRWVPVDGTRGRAEVGPDHIALTASTLPSSSAADLFLDLAQVIGNLKIEVLEEK
jgi:hypothetical protein